MSNKLNTNPTNVQNIEPVAWIQAGELVWDYGLIKKGRSEKMMNDKIPLYLHPAKTLTDEEIKEISYEHSKYGSIVNIYDFARALLRKANEK